MSQQSQIEAISDKVDLLANSVNTIAGDYNALMVPMGLIDTIQGKILDLEVAMAPLVKINCINPNNTSILDHVTIVPTQNLPTVNRGTIIYNFNDKSLKLYGKDKTGNEGWLTINFVV
jgi:hypothetical protein